MQSSLEFVLLMLCTAVIGVVVFLYLQLPSILGYLAVGVVIGPHSTGPVSYTHLDVYKRQDPGQCFPRAGFCPRGSI